MVDCTLICQCESHYFLIFYWSFVKFTLCTPISLNSPSIHICLLPLQPPLKSKIESKIKRELKNKQTNKLLVGEQTVVGEAIHAIIEPENNWNKNMTINLMWYFLLSGFKLTIPILGLNWLVVLWAESLMELYPRFSHLYQFCVISPLCLQFINLKTS